MAKLVRSEKVQLKVEVVRVNFSVQDICFDDTEIFCLKLVCCFDHKAVIKISCSLDGLCLTENAVSLRWHVHCNG